MTLFGPTHTYNMDEIGTCINSRVLSGATKLVRVQKIVCQYIELKAIADDLFDKFVCCIEYYRIKQFGGVIQFFVGLGYND